LQQMSSSPATATKAEPVAEQQPPVLPSEDQRSSWSKQIPGGPNRPANVATFLSRRDAYPTMSMTNYFDIDTKYSLPGFKRPDGSYNWHCGCVAKYVTGPCGLYFRKFMAQIDGLLKDDSAFDDPNARRAFEDTHNDVMRCAKRYEAYYKSFIQDIESGSAPSFDDVK
ncbi:hypothetical protein BOX15_Mlig023451g2, partial [Macrostomum lignano]